MTTLTQKKVLYELPELPYAYDSLEPYIDKETMQLHHDKHHAGYVKNLKNAIEEEGIEEESLDEILKKVSNYSAAIRNNGGGHYNHALFWNTMAPKAGGVPGGTLADAIAENLGSFEDFKTKFEDAAMKRFGSGWAWLIVQNQKLLVTSTANQDNPLMDTEKTRGIPILGIDVWEHAYYLKYQNRRAEYVRTFWNLVNWTEVQRRYEAAKG